MALVLLPSFARAQHDPRTGLEGAVHVGAGGFSNDGAFRRPGSSGHGSYSPSVGVHVTLGYRLIPLLSVGVRGLYQSLQTDPPRGTEAWAGAYAVGAYARLHPLGLIPARRGDVLSRLDLHVGAGFDFVANGFAHTRTQIFGATVETRGSSAGVAVPVTAGIDFALHENVAVGALFQWSHWTSSELCGQGFGFSGCDTGAHEAESYFFAGLGLRAHYSPAW
jgi:opacity protein-like surface antigen